MCRACMRLSWLNCNRCMQMRGNGLGRFVEKWFKELPGGHAAPLLASVRVLCALAAFKCFAASDSLTSAPCGKVGLCNLLNTPSVTWK